MSDGGVGLVLPGAAGILPGGKKKKSACQAVLFKFYLNTLDKKIYHGIYYMWR